METFNDSHTKQLQELVTCAICLDYYQDPHLLPCSHTFCFKCIEKLIKNGSFNCPLRDNMKIVQNDIAQLPINRTAKDMVEFILSINLFTKKKLCQQCDNCTENPAVNWCDKCAFHYCESCTTSVHSMKAFQSHHVIPSTEKVQSFCSDHTDEKFKYWCKQCEVLVCRDCLLFQHKDHTCSSLKDAASEAQSKFQETVQEIGEIKRNLTEFSKTTKGIISQRQEMVQKEKQNVEQTFDNLQRMLDDRKRTIIKELDDNELQAVKILDEQQSTIGQHLNLTIVQDLCLKKTLDSDDPVQILKFKSTLSHNYSYFTEQYKKIEEGYAIANYTFEKDDTDVQQISDIIPKLGRINSAWYPVKRDGIRMNTPCLDISKPDGEIKFTPKPPNYARGYNFLLKQPFQLLSICIQSDYTGEHVGFVVNGADIIICNGTVNSNDSTMKWLTIPLNYKIETGYSVLVWAASGNGSYACKNGNTEFRAVNQNCSVKSKYAPSTPQTNIGSKISINNNTYSINMILNVEG